MREIKGIIFDADGTLFDSMGLWDQAGEIYLRRKGIRPGKDIRERLETMTMEESAAYFRSSYGIELEQEDIIKEINSMIFDCYEKEIRIKPGLLPVLEDLKRRSVRMCIATSTERPLIEAAKKEETLVVEDAYFAAETAKKAGFLLAVIRDFYSEKDRDKLLKLADIYLESWEDWERKT